MYERDDENFVNNSGQGKEIEIPKQVKRFNWGAFFFTWIWGLFNKSYLTLILLAVNIIIFLVGFIFGILAEFSGDKSIAGLIYIIIMFLNLITNLGCLALCIWFGIKGNEWAWQNKKWDSLKHFHDVQRIWAILGTLIIGVGVVGIVAAMTLPSLIMNTEKVKNRAMVLKSLNTVQHAVLMNEAMEKKCELSSNGLASCFGERLNGSVNGNKFELADGNILEFTGNGYCAGSNSCYVKIITKNAEEKIGLYRDGRGYLKINSEDTKNITDKYKK